LEGECRLQKQYAWARNLDASSDPSPTAKHLHQSAGESAVPVSVENGQIIVNMGINGQEPFPMMFDTGGVEAVTPEAATALSLTSEGSSTVQGSGEGKIPVAFAHLKELRLAGQEEWCSSRTHQKECLHEASAA
jgi:hypothetical protein